MLLVPSPDTLNVFELPHGDRIRTETRYAQGNTVTPYYDPMLAKIIVQPSDRCAAIRQMVETLRITRLKGIKTSIAYTLKVLDDELFQLCHIHTGLGTDILAAG